MSEQSFAEKTRAVVQAYYVAFNNCNIDAMVAMVADDVIYDINQGERRQGKNRFHALCARMAHHYHDELKEILIMTADDGTRVDAEFNVCGTYNVTEPGLPVAAGQKYRLPAGTFFALHGEKITRISNYYNLTDWIMQVSTIQY